MKIALFSDLHLSHWDRRGFRTAESIIMHIEEQVKEINPDLVVDCGDSEIDFFYGTYKFNFPYVKIMGNHDYYGIEYNPHRTNNHLLSYFAGTLWTDLGQTTEYDSIAPVVVKNYMADFRYIKGFDLSDWRLEHSTCVDEINRYQPELIFTHHAPSQRSVHPRFHRKTPEEKAMNYGFVSNNLLDKIGYKPKLWLHGHVHDQFDYEQNGCRIVCNPLGYPGEHYRNFYDYKLKVVDIP